MESITEADDSLMSFVQTSPEPDITRDDLEYGKTHASNEDIFITPDQVPVDCLSASVKLECDDDSNGTFGEAGLTLQDAYLGYEEMCIRNDRQTTTELRQNDDLIATSGHATDHHGDPRNVENLVIENTPTAGPQNSSRPRPHICKICEKPFLTSAHLKNHYVVHDKERQKLSCKICFQTFLSATGLAYHTKRHSNDSYTCEDCNKTFVSEQTLKYHGCAKKKDKQTFVCSFCQKTFLTLSGLTQHNKNLHVQSMRHACTVCGKTFCNAYKLKQHQLLHTGEKSHVCQVCQTRFVNYNALAVHHRNHTGERPFQCQLCPKKFSTQGPLIRHSAVHSRVKKSKEKKSRKKKSKEKKPKSLERPKYEKFCSAKYCFNSRKTSKAILFFRFPKDDYRSVFTLV